MCQPMSKAISGGPDLSPVLVKVVNKSREDRGSAAESLEGLLKNHCISKHNIELEQGHLVLK